MARRIVLQGARLIGAATVFALAAGCATTSQVEEANATAQRAMQMAEEAKRTADAAQRAAQESQTCCQDVQKRIDSAFERSQRK